MSLLSSPIIREALIQGVVMAKMRSRPQTKAGLALCALSGILAAAAAFFLIYALFLAFSSAVPLMDAAALTAACLLGLAVVSGSIAAILIRRNRKRHALFEQGQLQSAIESILELIADEIDGPVSRNPKTALAVAGLAGLFAGKQIH